MHEWVAQYIGIPFLDHGRYPEEGLDCWGLVMTVQERHYGRRLPSLTGGYRDADDRSSVSYLVDVTRPFIGARSVPEPVDGDIALIRFSGHPVHTGVYVGGGMVLHARRALGVVCERVDGPHLRGKIEGYYRVV
jgi:cell wall-associated NlpC family hydrolase